MKIYFIIPAIIIFIIILFILFRIIFKKSLKLSLFNNDLNSSAIIPSGRNVNIGKSSTQDAIYKDNLNTKSKKTYLHKKRDKKPKLLDNKNKHKKPRKPRKKLLLKKDNNQISSINNALKKIEPKKNAINLTKNESANKPVDKNNAFLGLQANSFEDIYKSLGNSGLSDVVRYFEINNIKLINRRDTKKLINSSADFEEAIKNKIISFLNNQYEDLKDKISELRKNGKDMSDAEFILLSVPLKINLFSAISSKKDFDLIIKKIESIKEILKNYK